MISLTESYNFPNVIDSISGDQRRYEICNHHPMIAVPGGVGTAANGGEMKGRVEVIDP